MKKIFMSTAIGAIAGVLDVVPMIVQGLSWDANVSAFLMWVVIGFLFSVTTIGLPNVLKGILVSFLVLLPAAILIGWKDPVALIPIGAMTLTLGALLGLFAGKVIDAT